MNEFCFAALSFGLAARRKPGPLGIILIQQTLSKGLPAGIRASLAPLITDGPIIIAALWLLTQFKSIELFAAALGLLGGLYKEQNLTFACCIAPPSPAICFVRLNSLSCR